MDSKNIKSEVLELFKQQTAAWKTAADNYAALANIRIRKFSFGDFSVFVQFNPARMVSSGANVDASVIAKRLCFLCDKNRPEEQKSVLFGDYEILVNPYPIFPQHFTIPRKEHVPQCIEPYICDMFALASALPDYAIFYNGPKCGASAPDHMHFQACASEFLPLISDYFKLKDSNCRQYERTGRAVTFVLEHYLRMVYCIESSHMDALNIAFLKLYNEYITEPFVEPLMNIVCVYKDGKWYLFVMPRTLFRPHQYGADPDKQLLVSPATVEMSGIFITPIEEHFYRISANDIIDIYNQISVK